MRNYVLFDVMNSFLADILIEGNDGKGLIGEHFLYKCTSYHRWWRENITKINTVVMT